MYYFVTIIYKCLHALVRRIQYAISCPLSGTDSCKTAAAFGVQLMYLMRTAAAYMLYMVFRNSASNTGLGAYTCMHAIQNVG